MPGGTTTYNFTGGFPDDGFYTVANGTVGNPFGWHQIEDHTPGDVNGKLLVVNASFSAGEFYRTTVSGLCESTTYEFSAWVINLVIPNGFCSTQPGGTIPINVRFEIWDATDTNLLASGNTGNIIETATPNWLENGLVFQTLVGQDTAILKMINNGVGGCGNDLAIDDIEFKTCGDTISVTDASNNDSISICSGETPFSTTLIATPDNSVFSNHFYQWQESNNSVNWTDIAGETNQSITVSAINNTMYYRTKVAETQSNLTNVDCITFSDIYAITVIPAPDPPSIECWETATLDNATCSWDVTGTQPDAPTGLECWEVPVFNTATCSWDITGTQPEAPTDLECWQTITFNTTTCVWDVTGTQPDAPTGLECWEVPVFNTTTCSWDITGMQPDAPTDLECWQTTTFNTTTCIWDVTGTQPDAPTGLECWEVPVFNTTTCSWDITGMQPDAPTNLECWEVAVFNNTTCTWDIEGTEPVDSIEEDAFFCEDEDVTISASVGLPSPEYLWSNGAITEEITVDETGVYTVEISSVDDCVTIVKTITVVEISTPEIASITSDGTAIIVTMTAAGDYEYSLDGVTYQNSNSFINIEGGLYLVHVRFIGQEECGLATQEYLHFVIPKFFTPNNDGVNDAFELKGIELFEASEVAIFDRYGKLLKSAKNQPFAWDGTFVNQLMPTSDYWYVITINGQEFKGHFTLKR